MPTGIKIGIPIGSMPGVSGVAISHTADTTTTKADSTTLTADVG